MSLKPTIAKQKRVTLPTMDALAGYGSDDSDDDQPHQTAPIISSLAGYGDDDDDDDDDDDNDESEEEKLQPSKRLKLDQEQPQQAISHKMNNIQTTKSWLPPPPLARDSMIYCQTDYMSARFQHDTDNSPTKTRTHIPLNPKLKELATQSGQNWADQLKSQHAFHNPAFFQTAIQHFGIKDELQAANAGCGGVGGMGEVFHEYEFDLLRLEEEARIRQQQQQQQQDQQQQFAPIATSSAYVQEQLSRAMQRHG